MAKGYWIVQLDVTRLDAYSGYRAFVGPFLAKHGGRFLVRGGQQIVVEGSVFPRTVVVEFPTFADAENLYRSAEYQEGKKLRDGAAETNFAIVEGYDG